MPLLRNKLIKRIVAALAIKEVVERVQEARQPKRSFLRRNAGKIALLALAGAGFYAYQQRSGRPSLPGSPTGSGFNATREPSVEPDERLDAPLLAPSTTEAPEPAR